MKSRNWISHTLNYIYSTPEFINYCQLVCMCMRQRVPIRKWSLHSRLDYLREKKFSSLGWVFMHLSLSCGTFSRLSITFLHVGFKIATVITSNPDLHFADRRYLSDQAFSDVILSAKYILSWNSQINENVHLYYMSTAFFIYIHDFKKKLRTKSCILV